MYYDDLEVDYAENDRLAGEARRGLRDELPWMTAKEHKAMCRREDFPGLLAGYSKLAPFVLKMKKGKSRMVAAKLESNYSVSVRVDLVSGLVYLCEDGRYKECNLAGWMRIAVPMPAQWYPNPKRVRTRTVSCPVRSGRLDLMSASDMQSLVEDLEKAELLAPL